MDEMDDHEENKKLVVVKKPRNRKNKTHLIFNEDARREFLSGFRKRKNERRAKARELMEIQLKDDKKRLKDEHRNKLRKFLQNDRPVPEVEHILNPVVYDLPDHVVTISSNTDVDLASHDNVRLGLNKGATEEAEEERDGNLEEENDDYLKRLEIEIFVMCYRNIIIILSLQ
uniref:Nucleolar protein 12 n=1 Tax=Strigamia maritima TaxID=126957 RepID=T1IJQ8_STRMM